MLAAQGRSLYRCAGTRQSQNAEVLNVPKTSAATLASFCLPSQRHMKLESLLSRRSQVFPSAPQPQLHLHVMLPADTTCHVEARHHDAAVFVKLIGLPMFAPLKQVFQHVRVSGLLPCRHLGQDSQLRKTAQTLYAFVIGRALPARA